MVAFVSEVCTIWCNKYVLNLNSTLKIILTSIWRACPAQGSPPRIVFCLFVCLFVALTTHLYLFRSHSHSLRNSMELQPQQKSGHKFAILYTYMMLYSGMTYWGPHEWIANSPVKSQWLMVKCRVTAKVACYDAYLHKDKWSPYSLLITCYNAVFHIGSSLYTV